MKRLTFITIALSILLCAVCGTKSQQFPEKSARNIGKIRAKSRFITVKDRKFLDTEGREIILHGTNIVDKSREHNYLSWHGPKEFAMMREWGFNCIRLVIIWDGVEPEPGHYDDEYLAGVDKRIQWAKENGIYVILDMHQDLFSAKFGGDGAPDWAILDDGKPHIHNGSTWSMAYFTSPAVQAAFDNFWANKPVSDGIGLQDHFARAWQHVAERYADEPAVVGYDLFNEPFPGSTILQTLPLKFQAAADALAKKQGGKALSVTEIMQKFTEPNGLASYADDLDLYKAFADGGAFSMEFEQTVLASFYNRVAKAIRQVDRNHILFMETHILCNAGTPSGVVPILDGNGNRDPLQAFAPHGYDIVTDTDRVANASAERIDFIYGRHAETAERLEMPVIVGEWGAFYGQPNTLYAAQMVVSQIEKHLFSDTYWSYSGSKEVDGAPYFPVIARPYPAAVAGILLHYESDLAPLPSRQAGLDNKSFSCIWLEEPAITAPSLIYLPAQWFPEGYSVDLQPKPEGWSFEPTTSKSSSGYVVIPPTGQQVERKLYVNEKSYQK
jgi:endoglycosylceramidase